MSKRNHPATISANLRGQAKLDRLIRESQQRLAIGATIKNSRGTAVWNGTAWVYGRTSR
jgi:hypothetical protein